MIFLGLLPDLFIEVFLLDGILILMYLIFGLGFSLEKEVLDVVALPPASGVVFFEDGALLISVRCYF